MRATRVAGLSYPVFEELMLMVGELLIRIYDAESGENVISGYWYEDKIIQYLYTEDRMIVKLDIDYLARVAKITVSGREVDEF